MGEWASYELADLILFAPDTYIRQYQLLNVALWPLHVLMLVTIVAAAWLSRPRATRGSGALWLLAPAWFVSGWWFLYQHYAPINIAAEPFAVLFLIQSALLIGAAALRVEWHRLSLPTALPGWLLLAYAFVVHPLLGLVAGRDPTALEWFGLAPDPTALATLGVLLIWRGRLLAWLLVIPLLWCQFSGLTYLAMGLLHGLVTPLLAFGAVIARYAMLRSSPT